MTAATRSPAPSPSLIFRARGRLCAVALEHVLETMRPLPVDTVPGVPGCVSGLAVLRGAAVPVIDVARLLGAPPGVAPEGAPGARFVAVRVGDRTVALAVEAVVGVRALDLRAFGELPPLLRDADADAVASVGTLDDELLLVLRAARLVPDGAPLNIVPGAPS